MLFSSIPFLFWFLPGVLILYAAAPGSLKNTVLLLSSLFFYGWGEPRYVIWMMLAILMAYIFGLLIERYQSVPKLARLFLALSVSSSLTSHFPSESAFIPSRYSAIRWMYTGRM